MVSTQRRRYEKTRRAEAEEVTRAKIAAAAASLHEEVGVGATTVADIARRAGVTRVTVYRHFPDLEALLPACSAHWMANHPQPDLGPAFAMAEPVARLRAALAAVYGWYREGAAMQRRVRGERATIPELDAWMARSSDVGMGELARALAEGFEHRRARALIAVALDFWTWSRLDAEGLTDRQAAELMAAIVDCPQRRGRTTAPGAGS